MRNAHMCKTGQSSCDVTGQKITCHLHSKPALHSKNFNNLPGILMGKTGFFSTKITWKKHIFFRASSDKQCCFVVLFIILFVRIGSYSITNYQCYIQEKYTRKYCASHQRHDKNTPSFSRQTHWCFGSRKEQITAFSEKTTGNHHSTNTIS